MRKYRLLFISTLLSLSVLACESRPAKKTKPKPAQKVLPKQKKVVKVKKQEPALPPKPEKILPTTETAEEFFKAYGKENPEQIVEIYTEYGNIKIKLYQDVPIHRASFIYLTKEGYWDYSIFHRVLDGFIVQGGNTDLREGAQFKRAHKSYKLTPEINPKYKHRRGTVAMAREYRKDLNPNKLTSAFEFYIIQGRDELDHLDGEHTIIGEVISGMSTVDKLAKVKTGSDQMPTVDVRMKVKVIR